MRRSIRSTGPGRRPTRHPSVESLEGRRLFAAISLTGTGGDDTLVVTATGPDSGSYKLNGGSAVAFTGATSFSFTGGTGNDLLVINNPAGGLFAPTGGITYDGGGDAGDGMQLLGGTSERDTYAFSTSSTGNYATIAHIRDSVGVTQSLNLTRPVTITDTVPSGTLTLSGAQSSADVNVLDGPIISGIQTTEVNGGTTKAFGRVDFANKTTAEVFPWGGAGTTNVMSLALPHPAAGLTNFTIGPNSVYGTSTLTINGDVRLPSTGTLMLGALPCTQAAGTLAVGTLRLHYGSYTLTQPGNDIETLFGRPLQLAYADANDLTIGADGLYGAQSAYVRTGGTLSLVKPLDFGQGTVALDVGSGINQVSDGGYLGAKSLLLTGAGDFNLGKATYVGTLAADVDGALTLANRTSLAVGSVTYDGKTTAGVDTNGHTATLLAAGDLTLGSPVNTGLGAAILTATAGTPRTGGIIDGNGTALDILAKQIALSAAAGIGAADAIETSAPGTTPSELKLAFANTAGAVNVANIGPLTVVAPKSIDATSTLTASTNSGTTTTVSTTAGTLTFAADTTSAGNLTATAVPTNPPAPSVDDITVSAGATIQSAGGGVYVIAGDGVNVRRGGTVIAANGGVTFGIGFGVDDGDGGGTIAGTVSGKSVVVQGGLGNDTLTLDFSGGSPFPGGRFDYDGGGDTNILSFIGTPIGDTVAVTPTTAEFESGVVSVTGSLSRVQAVRFAGGSGGSDALNVTGGTYVVDADTPAAAGVPNVAVSASGAATAVTFAASQHLAGLTLSGGGTATVASVGPTRTAANHRILVAGALSIDAASGSKLDLADNDLVLRGGGSAGLASLQSLISSGYAKHVWNGGGIVSSAAAGKTTNALGYLLNDGSIVKAKDTFGPDVAPETVGNTDVLVKYTWEGDSNLDGQVSFDDYFYIDSKYPKPSGSTWVTGDFDYNAQTSFDDYFYIDSNYPRNSPL